VSGQSHLVESAIDACEAVRALNHQSRGAIPAPVVYDVLANLKCVGHMLPQAFHQLGQGLARSLSEYDVYDDGSDPAKNVDLACSYLAEASRKAADIGRLLGVRAVCRRPPGLPDPCRRRTCPLRGI
jgi:hypothetical protein